MQLVAKHSRIKLTCTNPTIIIKFTLDRFRLMVFSSNSNILIIKPKPVRSKLSEIVEYKFDINVYLLVSMKSRSYIKSFYTYAKTMIH